MVMETGDLMRRAPSGPLPRLFAKHFAEGEVVGVETLGRRWKAVRIYCADMARLTYRAGQHVRVELRDPFSLYGILRPIETMRTYTIWKWDEEWESFQLRVHLYDGDGIGLNWARKVKVGDRLRFWGPQGDFLVRPAKFHLFVGDDTAAPAFAPMIRSLPGSEDRLGLLASDNMEDRLDDFPANADIRWQYRQGRSPVASEDLVSAVRRLSLPDGDTVAYVAGEAKTCQMIRDHLLKERGWDRSQILVKPFWTLGKRGLH